MQAPLGYVFWHWPRGGANRREYERKLLLFQESLLSHPPRGLVDAMSFREKGLPWSNGRSVRYEDWYLVSDFASLGFLNEGAVALANKRTHDEVAAEALGGSGGLYRQLIGGLRMRQAQHSTWLKKPSRTSYQDFIQGISSSADGQEIDVWQRQLVLGRAPEFCVHSLRPVGFPKSFGPVAVGLELVKETER